MKTIVVCAGDCITLETLARRLRVTAEEIAGETVFTYNVIKLSEPEALAIDRIGKDLLAS